MDLCEKQVVNFQDLGRISYKEAWDYQQGLMKELVDRKLANRSLPKEEQAIQQHFILFCEHPHVYTLGKSGSLDNLLLNETELAEKSISFYKINRGGDITYHGPGQIVGYPILDLEHFFTDVHKYVRYLEEAVIRTLLMYNIEGERIEGYTGVWIVPKNGPKRKICAIGVHLSRWVTMHGFAFNINTALDYFGNIIPCGIEDKDKTVTSMANELGKKVDIEEIKYNLKQQFAEIFGFIYQN